jgi:hypothetical protein
VYFLHLNNENESNQSIHFVINYVTAETDILSFIVGLYSSPICKLVFLPTETKETNKSRLHILNSRNFTDICQILGARFSRMKSRNGDDSDGEGR